MAPVIIHESEHDLSLAVALHCSLTQDLLRVQSVRGKPCQAWR